MLRNCNKYLSAAIKYRHFTNSKQIRKIPATMSSKNENSQNWNPKLTHEQLLILRDKQTESPHTGAYLNNKEQGIYHCANCDSPLYSSGTKFNSGCGWPAFYQEISKDALTYNRDKSFGMTRTEICCGKCGGHLGHVFEGEGWKERLDLPSDSRHCVNSASLSFKKK